MRTTAVLFGVLVAVVLAPGSARADAADDVARDQAEFIRAHGDRPVAAIRVEGLTSDSPGRGTSSGSSAKWVSRYRAAICPRCASGSTGSPSSAPSRSR